VTHIAVLTNDDQLLEMLRGSGLKIGQIDAVDFANYSRASDAPSAVVIDVRGNHPQLPPGVPEFRRAHAQSAIVVVVSKLDPQFMLNAMRAGVNECLPEPLTREMIDEALRSVVVGAQPEPAGQVFAFVGAKGGVGTSTLAVNTVAALHKQTKAQALMIDLHLVHGDAALFFGSDPRFSVVDAIENVHRVDESFFSGLVEKTRSGVHVLGSSSRPIHGAMDPQRTRSLLDFAKHKYPYTVLDVPRSDFAMLDALDPVTSIVVITSQEVSALRSATHTAETLRQRYGAARVRVVLNRFDKNAAVATSDIERVLGEPLKHQIPSDYRVAVEAVNTGIPLVLGDSKLAKAIRNLAIDLAGITKDPENQPAPGGVLSRLAWRRI
jgi:pilus assembly protein CpaE